ncbi:hypothetical protein SEEM1594_18832 [Salmonella enterica subsp. enterica serovar Muenchen str. baa1594]|nr:hypothetical protein SEEM1594_18832 [Salmonella enterica subsp. enterica serovar Muenchen str. baa1594]
MTKMYRFVTGGLIRAGWDRLQSEKPVTFCRNIVGGKRFTAKWDVAAI